MSPALPLLELSSQPVALKYVEHKQHGETRMHRSIKKHCLEELKTLKQSEVNLNGPLSASSSTVKNISAAKAEALAAGLPFILQVDWCKLA